MARSVRSSAATERVYLQFGGAVVGSGCRTPGEEFDESDIWGAFSPAPRDPSPAEPRLAHHRPVLPAARTKAVAGGGRAAAHGSLPVNIPDWSKILGDEYYRSHHAGDWELDDADDEDVGGDAGAVVPPHELAWRRRAPSLSSSAYEGEGAGVVGRTLKVRDAVWKRTTGFQD